MPMHKVWMRLGVELNLSEKEIDLLKKGELSQDMFESIVKRGFTISGDSYPVDDELGLDDSCAMDIKDIVISEVISGVN